MSWFPISFINTFVAGDILNKYYFPVFGGSLELPMWLTDGFLVTFFGRWWGAVRIHVSHVQLPYTVHCTRWTHVWWWGQYMHTCVPTATVHGAPYTVHRTRCTHVWWWGQYTHTCVPTATIHGAPYTVYSRVVVGAIYAYMCTYSYRTWCTHVWWWGQYTHTCVPTATVHGVPYTVNSHVVVGAIYAYMCTYSYRTWCTVHSELTCGGGIHVWELLTCAGDIHVWELLTCETSHQSEILHSLIFILIGITGNILSLLVSMFQILWTFSECR